MDNIINEAYLNGCVHTLYKRKRYIEELNSNIYTVRTSGERMALNTPIQGTSADIIKMAMIKIDEEIHDELVFDIVLDEKEKITNIVKNIMENIVSLKVPLKVSCDFGNDLYETK